MNYIYRYIQEKEMSRRKFSPEEKVKLLKRHLLEGEKVSELCKEADIHPNHFSKWKREFLRSLQMCLILIQAKVIPRIKQ